MGHCPPSSPLIIHDYECRCGNTARYLVYIREPMCAECGDTMLPLVSECGVTGDVRLSQSSGDLWPWWMPAAIGLFWVLLLAANCQGTMPHESVLSDRCDLVELNHFHCEQGHLILSQVVWWDLHRGEYHVRDWRLLKSESLRPRYDYARGEWRSAWQDGERHREVIAATFRESWTQWDVELLDREKFHADRRRKLREK